MDRLEIMTQFCCHDSLQPKISAKNGAIPKKTGQPQIGLCLFKRVNQQNKQLPTTKQLKPRFPEIRWQLQTEMKNLVAYKKLKTADIILRSNPLKSQNSNLG